ncbi:MAG: AraC family transcriptional regulator [Clostridia bacterium]|nr:AraC family transcriptional regulator [Clostridia bacterium]
MIILDETRGERVEYSFPDYNAYIRCFLCENPSLQQRGGIAHWHNDVEFLVTLRGTAEHSVNGELLTLHPGETIFVNSRQMHYVRPVGEELSEILCIRLNPKMLSMSPFFDSTYVLPVTQNRAMPYLILRQEEEWQAEVIRALNEMYRHSTSRAVHLKIHGLFCYIWSLLFENMPESAPQDVSAANDLASIQAMLEYIELHYAKKLPLSRIAEAGRVCESKCCRLFGKYVRKTPTTYLNHYRLGKASELLLTTELPVTEIALACGFSGTSYFSESFRKLFGQTPMEYRRKKHL